MELTVLHRRVLLSKPIYFENKLQEKTDKSRANKSDRSIKPFTKYKSGY